MEKFLEYLKSIFRLKCSHNTAGNKNCKYCPDCGKKVVCRWIVIKCKSCGHYRTPLIDRAANIKPAKKYCFFCGSDKWTNHNYYEATIPDSLKSISARHIEAEEEHKFGSLTAKTKIWVSFPGND